MFVMAGAVSEPGGGGGGPVGGGAPGGTLHHPAHHPATPLPHRPAAHRLPALLCPGEGGFHLGQ